MPLWYAAARCCWLPPAERAPAIAHQVGCDDQTVRNVIHDFHAEGLAVLQEGSSRPKRLRTACTEEGCQRLRDLLHRPPRDFGKERSRWTLDLAAQVSLEQGIIPTLVSDESVRRALKRLGTNWKRAKHWITSPDPEYLVKKCTRPFDRLGQKASHLGEWLWGCSLVESVWFATGVCLAKSGPARTVGRASLAQG